MKHVLIFAAMLLLMTSCSIVRETSTSARKDTLYLYKEKIDSVFVRDSIFVREKGDTIYKYVERWRYRDRIIRDTLYRSKTDSVYIDIVTTHEVVKPLTWWQKALMWTGVVAMLAIILIVAKKFLKIF